MNNSPGGCSDDDDDDDDVVYQIIIIRKANKKKVKRTISSTAIRFPTEQIKSLENTPIVQHNQIIPYELEIPNVDISGWLADERDRGVTALRLRTVLRKGGTGPGRLGGKGGGGLETLLNCPT